MSTGISTGSGPIADPDNEYKDGKSSKKEKTPPVVYFQPLLFSAGLYLNNMMRSVITLTETPEETAVIQKVIDLMDANCQDSEEWRKAIDPITKLLNKHPGADQGSGPFRHGRTASYLALAAAEEAGYTALEVLNPRDHELACKPDWLAYKVFRYTLEAFAKSPERAPGCLDWVVRSLDYLKLPR